MKQKNKWSVYYEDEKHNLVLELVNEGNSITSSVQKMCLHFGLEKSGHIEKEYRRRIYNNSLYLENTKEFKDAKNKIFNDKKQKFIITWAQAETSLHEDLLTNIEAYAKFIDADIHVIAGRYKNPNSLEASNRQIKKDKNKIYWDKRVIPYLDANRQKLHDYLCVLSDIKVQPTASLPLSGFNSLTALESCIIGHPRVHLKSLPVLDDYPNKLLLTTGAVTLPNYTDTKLGAQSKFHHTFGFIVVELDDDVFHARQVQSDEDGNFYDLDLKIKDGICKKIKCNYPAIVFGDLHYGSHDQVSLNKSLEIAKKFNCEIIVLHDIFDGKSINHHELNNPFAQLRNEETGDNNLENEISNVVDFLNSNKNFNFLVISSNHDNFIDRWLQSNDWRKNYNRKAFLKYANIVANNLAPDGIIPYILAENTSNTKCLGLNNSYRLLGWELSQHGHLGVNGSRGSVNQFKTLNTKTITAHSHTPERIDGSVSVGTLTKKRLNYNNGASSWLHSNVLMYPNGKVSHINLINGRYTTL